MQTRIRNLRIVGIAEGVSFLVLLLIAMPLKYRFNFPEAVKIIGWIHGILFMAFVLMVFICIKAMRWNWFWVLIALAASVIPLGTFFLDRQLKRRELELAGI